MAREQRTREVAGNGAGRVAGSCSCLPHLPLKGSGISSSAVKRPPEVSCVRKASSTSFSRDRELINWETLMCTNERVHGDFLSFGRKKMKTTLFCFSFHACVTNSFV